MIVWPGKRFRGYGQLLHPLSQLGHGQEIHLSLWSYTNTFSVAVCTHQLHKTFKPRIEYRRNSRHVRRSLAMPTRRIGSRRASRPPCSSEGRQTRLCLLRRLCELYLPHFGPFYPCNGEIMLGEKSNILQCFTVRFALRKV